MSVSAIIASSVLAASTVCTSVISPSGDPHSAEYVRRIEINVESAKAELKEFRFEAFELWGVENIDELLTEDRLEGEVKELEVEEVTKVDPQDKSVTYELYSTKDWQWTLDSILTINGKTGERKVTFNGYKYLEKMNCK